MQINSVYNTSFQSRNSQIRQADKLLRVINREFPAISTSKFATYFSDVRSEKPYLELLFADNDKYQKTFPRRYIPPFIRDKFFEISDSLNILRKCYSAISNKFNTALFYKLFAKSVKGNASKIFANTGRIGSGRIANCAEQTRLAQLVLGINDIDSIPVSIKRYRNRAFEELCSDNSIKTFNLPLKTEHDFVIVPHEGKTLSKDYIENTPLVNLKDCLVFDPWCGFVDTPANAALKYFGEHYSTVGKTIRSRMQIPDDKIYYNKIYLGVSDMQDKFEIKDSVREELKKEFPELIVK